MSEFSEGIVRDMKERARPVMREVNDKGTEIWREVLSVPVGRSGRKIIRSKPGEPPRKEKGRLPPDIKGEVTSGESVVTSNNYTDNKVAGYLDGGTRTIAPRPHAVVVARRLFAFARGFIGNAIFGR